MVMIAEIDSMGRFTNAITINAKLAIKKKSGIMG